MNLRLDWATHKAAEFAVLRYHYSRTMPVSKSAKIGVWEDETFKGVVIFALGANPNMGTAFSLGMFEAAELVRIALTAHVSPVSRIIAIAVRMLRKQSPGLRLLVSYADTDQGHHGGIYQAAGWIYSGTTATKFDFILNGQKLQRRAYTGKNFGMPRMELPAGAQKVLSPVKHRYLMPLDAEMGARILPLAKPYPKRTKDQASALQADLGSETLTRPLQLSQVAG